MPRRLMSAFLKREFLKPATERNFGILRTPPADRNGYRLARAAAPQIMAADDRRDTCLVPWLLNAFPNWSWGWQGTGDCVSWEWSVKLDTLAAVLIGIKKLAQEIRARIASEAIYALGRVEIFGRRYSRGQGMYGRAAARAVQKLGTLHRLQYLDGAFDLRQYSGRRSPWSS